MSTSTLITDVDIAARRASKIPGPGEYNVDSAHKFNGGRFVCEAQDRAGGSSTARADPWAGQYRRLDAAAANLTRHPESDLEIIMMRSARLPGPGAYDSDPYSVTKRTGAVPPMRVWDDLMPCNPTAFGTAARIFCAPQQYAEAQGEKNRQSLRRGAPSH